MSKENLSEYEKLRLKNIEDNKKMMMELGLLNAENEPSTSQNKRAPKTKKNVSQKENVEPTGSTGSQENKQESKTLKRRRSTRLQNQNSQPVEFTEDVARAILGEINTCQVNQLNDDESTSETEMIEPPVRRRRTVSRTNTRGVREVVPPEQVTIEQLNNVAYHLSERALSPTGTTCHQCRQKTRDQKSICRSGKCTGVKGQYCGPCLRLRYGQNIKRALKDPKWSCPYCIGNCNCSICRTRWGLLPTGQMYHLAQARGYESVHHFLEQEGDREDV